ncbi:MAG TPA: hypothetical protein VLB83_05450 [Candidatus Paceibacterota bacterium]|nr:hypothetical protein [Candidatus Paceibacterota bacterium]
MLDLRSLPTFKDWMPKHPLFDRCIDTRRIIEIVSENFTIKIIERTQTISIDFPSIAKARLAFPQIVSVVRLANADRVRIGEIPGFEGTEHSSYIVRKSDIELIEIVSAGAAHYFAQLSVATRSGVRVYVGRDLGTDGEVPAVQALLDAIFCS